MEPLLHFSIPFVIISLTKAKLRYSILAGIIALLPDLDVLFHAHRSISHSFIVSLALLGFLFINRKFGLIAFFSWSSHIFLDFIDGYVPLLWPLSDEAYSLIFEGQIEIYKSLEINLIFGINEMPYNYGSFNNFEAPIFTFSGLIISLILLTITLLSKRG